MLSHCCSTLPHTELHNQASSLILPSHTHTHSSLFLLCVSGYILHLLTHSPPPPPPPPSLSHLPCEVLIRNQIRLHEHVRDGPHLFPPLALFCSLTVRPSAAAAGLSVPQMIHVHAPVHAHTHTHTQLTSKASSGILVSVFNLCVRRREHSTFYWAKRGVVEGFLHRKRHHVIMTWPNPPKTSSEPCPLEDESVPDKQRRQRRRCHGDVSSIKLTMPGSDRR